jgi:prolyl-tRNA editing enzyme YbaK/EbsC (Cys-tRNA(Pro) deacylase)
MHSRVETFVERSHVEYGFDPDVYNFPAGTRTASEAANVIGCDIEQIATSLAFDVNDRLVVCIASGEVDVNEGKLAAHFDASKLDVSMPSPDKITDTLGWAIAGVPPFCHAEPVPCVMADQLLEYETVWAAAGTPRAVFPIDPETLGTLAEADPIDLA